MDERKEMKENYTSHVWAQLNYDFYTFRHRFVKKVVKKHKYHLLPIVQELEATMEDILSKTMPLVHLSIFVKNIFSSH